MPHFRQLWPLVLVTLASPAAWAQDSQDEGISVQTLVVARDSASAQQAVVTEFLVRQSFARNPRYSPLDLEGFLSADSPPPARALIEEGRKKLQRGQQMYDAFELGPAVATLNEAVLAFERGAGALTDPQPYIKALQWLGASYALQADRKAAKQSFVRALLINRRAQLQGAGFPPTVMELYSAAREDATSRPQARLTVYSNPAAAEVYVDGVFRGTAPLTVEGLGAGQHLLRVYRAGFQGFGQVVKLVEGSEKTVQAALKPCAQAAQFESLARRAGIEATQDGMGQASSELGAWLKVDQLMVVLVTASGDDVTLQAALYDAAASKRIHAATRTFMFSSPRYRADVEDFILGEFRQAQLGAISDAGTAEQIGSGYAPQRRTQALHPGFLWGGISLAGGVVALAAGIVLNVFTVDVNNTLAKTPQVDASSQDLMSTGKLYFWLSVTGYSLSAIATTSAVILFAVAANHEENVETILSTPGAGGDLTAHALHPGGAQ